MLPRPVARALFHLAALSLALQLAGCGGPERPVRIVLVTLDTLRADGLEKMPLTAAYARRGARFERAYAATSTTQPTHASLLTGLHPWEHGVTDNGEVLDERFETLAERLSERGFHTNAVVASFPLERRFGFAQGFDKYEDEFHVAYARRWEGEELEDERFYSLADTVTGEALSLVNRAHGERQFFWIHYFDPHDPYGDARAPASVLAGSDALLSDAIPVADVLSAAAQGGERARKLVEEARSLYERDLAELDRSLARLFERLDAESEHFETHVLLTADHGESFGERGCLGHGKRLVPEQVHVPLFVVSPRFAAGTRADATGSVDVAATILSLADAGTSGVAGRDLSEPTRAGAAFGMRRSFAEGKTELLLDGSVLPVQGDRFFALHEGRLFAGDAATVFEDDDPSRPAEPALAAELGRAFAGFSALLGGTSTEELKDEETLRALRALGYDGHE